MGEVTSVTEMESDIGKSFDLLSYWPFLIRWITVSRIMQKWWQFKEGNRVYCGKVAASVYISVQWKAFNEVGGGGWNEWRKGMRYSIMTSVSVMTIYTDRNTLGWKQRRDENPCPCLPRPAWFLISWPTVTELIKNDSGSILFLTWLLMEWSAVTYFR